MKHKKENNKKIPSIKYFSMFSGIGGFELGIELATKGLAECVGYSEIDKFATQVYRKHYPNHKNYGDITKIVAEELPNFNVLIGGVPCQSWSLAGHRKGFEDARGTMWYEAFRIIDKKKPKYILLENVKGLLSHDGGKSFEQILEVICELGYVVDFTVLNSKNFGVPQNRERVFILGIREDIVDKKEVI